MQTDYYYDFEFIEGVHKPFFGKKRHFVDMISVGIVCGDGREYYAISKEYEYKTADKWVRDNVIHPLYIQTVPGPLRDLFNEENFHKAYGKTNKQISAEIFTFTKPSTTIFAPEIGYDGKGTIKLYGYYSAYDHYLISTLFGRMIQLPGHFPMYTTDLKQMLDEKVNALSYSELSRLAYDPEVVTHNVYSYFESKGEDKISLIKNARSYPQQINEHDALEDAHWNKKLHEFILKLCNGKNFF